MNKRIVLIFSWLAAIATFAQADTITLATMNCYWFLGQEESQAADKPRTTEEYSLKAGHLVGLLPAEPPLFIGLQEIGNDRDVQALAHSAFRRYGHTYASLFSQGKDTATKQDVGALFDTAQGWGVYGQASRVSELERELSKHLVVRLTNAVATLDVAVVHLRRAIGAEGSAKQKDQCRALLRWAMRHLAKNPQANVVILGDLNETKPVGSPEQSLAVLFQAQPPMVDAFAFLRGKARTHAGGGAFDRILVSEAIVKGAARLKFDSVEIRRHSHGKGEDRRLYTDHFPVTVKLVEVK